MGVKPGTGLYKSSDNTSTKYHIFERYNIEIFRVQFLVLLLLYLVDVLSELL
jgi:hypothetical protein